MGLKVDPAAQDAIRTLAPAVKGRVREALRLLAEDPFHSDLDWKVLATHGPDRLVRVRLGDYRIVYLLRPDHRYVLRVMHRREGYGWLERLGAGPSPRRAPARRRPEKSDERKD